MDVFDSGLERTARELQSRAIVVDLHADPLLWSRLCGYDILRRHRHPLPRAPYFAHGDVPRWRECGMSIVLTGVVTLPYRRDARGCFAQARTTIGLAHTFAEKSAGAFEVIETESAWQSAKAKKNVGALLALEGVHAVEGSIDRLDRLIDMGLRSCGLAHFQANAATGCAYGPGGDRGFLANAEKSKKGLTDFGRDLVDRLGERNIAVDLAHVSRSGFLEAAKRAKHAPFVSHTGIAGAHTHWRNIDDTQIRAIVERDGIIGIIFAGRFLGGDTIEDVVRHAEYVIEKFGDRHVAIGSDWDGMIVPVRGLGSVTDLWKLTATFLARGHSEERVARILGGNAVRYLESVRPTPSASI